MPAAWQASVGTTDAYPVFPVQKRELLRLSRFTISTAGTVISSVSIRSLLERDRLFPGLGVNKNGPLIFEKSTPCPRLAVTAE